MNGPVLVAEHLDDRTDSIIGTWQEAVRQAGDVPRSGSLTYQQFLDHVPVLLDRMADRLRGQPVDVSSVAEKHGRMRYEQGYDVSEVVAELGHLRSALSQATFASARENDFDLTTLESAQAAIDDVLNEAMAESVRQFHEDSQAAAETALAQAEAGKLALEVAQAEAESERGKLRALLASLPVGVWVADSDGKIIEVNREAEALQQFPAEATVGRLNVLEKTPVFELHRPDGSGYLPAEFPLSRALRGAKIEQEEVLWSQSDCVRVVTVSAAPLPGPGGSIVGAVAVAQDVTTRRAMEARLADLAAQHRAIVERSPVMIWRTGPDGRNDFVNQTYLDYLGLSPEQVERGGWMQVVHPEDRSAVVEIFRAAFDNREPFARKFRVRRADGQYRWITSRGVPYLDDSGQYLGYLGTSLDVTEQVELEDALDRQRRLAEESSQHKTRLMSALSHDARTPLNAVVLSAQLLEMHVQDQDDPEVVECLRTIRNGVKNVLDLLGDLLDLTRIDAGAMPAEPSRFVLEAALAECFSSVETQARLKGLGCRFEPDGLVKLTVATDRAKLKQIVSNFLSNALRYTDRGQIRLYGGRSQGRLTVSVQDSGAGIAPADQARVFDEFATLENPRRPAGEGTGLGLAICKRLAGLLGGEIVLESAVGRGSTFTLALPDSILVDGEPDEARPHGPTASATTGPIVVAEDHKDSRQTLGRLLRRMGYRVLEAADGDEALQIARQERPLAILMDINMPGMDGIDATLALRADPTLRSTPIFALTGDVTADNQRRIGEAGVQGYLEKPVTSEALKKALGTLL